MQVGNTDKFTVLNMHSEDSSTKFMSEIYTRIKSGQGDASHMNRDTTVIDTSIGPCMLMGAMSWLVLFTLYHWLA